MAQVDMIEAKYVLNTDEKRELADEVSKLIATINDLRVQKAQEMSRLNGEIKEAEGTLQRKSLTYRLGYEMRQQPATVERDYEAGYVRWYHAETGVLLKERPMTYDERQRQMDFA